MGVKAVEIVDAEVDFTKATGITYYGWGRSDAAAERLSLDRENGLWYHSEEATEVNWDVQFFPIGGVNIEEGVTYTLTVRIKGTPSASMPAHFAGVSNYSAISFDEDWQDLSVDYTATGTSGDLLIQCGSFVGDYWISYMKITHEGREEKPVEWIENISNGNAEKSWEELGLANVTYNDEDNFYKVCAWAKEAGHNINEYATWAPFPATIENVDGNNVFVVHAQQTISEGDASSWDNQFWIQSPKAWKTGDQLKIHFRYKASQEANTNTQFHLGPDSYLIWHAIGDIRFTEEWQEFDKTITVPDDSNGFTAIAFNLSSEVKDATDFYFDDLSWQSMKLKEGFFAAGIDTDIATAADYDFDNAVEFVWDDYEDAYVCTVGTKGDMGSWVNQLMISTAYGNDKGFKASTIKVDDRIDSEVWYYYTNAGNAKINLPSKGVWQIMIDPVYKQINFQMLEGDYRPHIDIYPNPAVVTVYAQERDDLADTVAGDGSIIIREDEGGTGYAWDNQFFIVANRPLRAGESTLISFRYKSSIPSWTSTFCYKDVYEYLHWAAIGSVYFDTEWQDFEKTFTIPEEADGMQTLAFNMAEIKEACDYHISNIVWKLADDTETLINMEGVDNFWVKEGAG